MFFNALRNRPVMVNQLYHRVSCYSTKVSTTPSNFYSAEVKRKNNILAFSLGAFVIGVFTYTITRIQLNEEELGEEFFKAAPASGNANGQHSIIQNQVNQATKKQ